MDGGGRWPRQLRGAPDSTPHVLGRHLFEAGAGLAMDVMFFLCFCLFIFAEMNKT